MDRSQTIDPKIGLPQNRFFLRDLQASMTNRQKIAAVVGVAAIGALSAVMWPKEPIAQEVKSEKQRELEWETTMLRAKLDERGGYQRQLKQGAITCEFKPDFQQLAAYNSLTPEIIARFDCREWDLPTWFSTDIQKSDPQFIYVRLPIVEERWHWALRSSISNFGHGIPSR
jgi:hypothetical protein